MNQPLKLLELKSWPDILLAMFSPAFIISITAIYPPVSRGIAIPTSIIICGVLFFGLGGRVNHYYYRDEEVKGNKNAWVPGWRHTFLGYCFVVIGLALILFGGVKAFDI